MIDDVVSTKVEDVASSRLSQRIVVGVDGSDGSLAALSWALDEARLRGVTLHAVLGWRYHPSWAGEGTGSMFPMGYTALGGMLPPAAAPPYTAQSTEADLAAAASNVLDQALSDAVQHDGKTSQNPPVNISRTVIEGHGAKVLLDEVSDSDVLVVGSHGHGGFVGALLGSVSHHVVSQAPCAVVVVPGQQFSNL